LPIPEPRQPVIISNASSNPPPPLLRNVKTDIELEAVSGVRADGRIFPPESETDASEDADLSTSENPTFTHST